MDIVASVAELRARLAAERARHRRIALVPTMGALHPGHLRLVDAARAAADCVVMSIFVNPLQFGPGEDFERYPRDLARDSATAQERGVDVLFAPPVGELYPHEPAVRVTAGAAGARWEGAVRPGHFDGVLTVVAKLFHIVQPDQACFGQKDIQQLLLVRQMVGDLDMPVDVVMVPTVRDADGLALSSRNAYLDAGARANAPRLWRALQLARQRWVGGEGNSQVLHDVIAAELARSPAIPADYIAVFDPRTLAPVERAERGNIIALAARVGATRLLDNVILEPPEHAC